MGVKAERREGEVGMKEPMQCRWKIYADVGVLGIRIEGLRLVSEANQREAWYQRNARKKVQQEVVKAALRGLDPLGYLVTSELRITLIRQGMRTLDTDNLAGSGKHVRDAIAKHIGIDDGSPLLEWCYEQRKGPYGVEIRFEQRKRGAA